MARGVLSATVGTTSGVTMVAPVTGDPANGHQVANSGRTKILVKNTGAGARWVKFSVFRTVDNQTVTAVNRSIPAGTTKVFSGFGQDDYGTTLLVDVEHAEVTLQVVE